MFSSNKLVNYLFLFSVLAISSYFANQARNAFKDKDEYELIKKYLLNDSPLYGFNRPKLWVHSKYEVNSRKWKSFMSRNSTDLNEPYIHLTIKTIINHCGNDFNICLIDDNTFNKLIPTWDIDITSVAEPMKSRYREIGMMSLVYYYGGMVVPNSFVCLKNLHSFYKSNISSGKPFICENVNHSVNLMATKNKVFMPSLYMYGAEKHSEHVKEMIEYLKSQSLSGHFSNECEFVGKTADKLDSLILAGKWNLVGGEYTGVITMDRKPVMVDQLMEEAYLDFNKNIVGVYIPESEILNRTKYQWFAVMDANELLQRQMIISKYLAASIVDSTSEYQSMHDLNPEHKMKSIISI